MKEKSSKRIKIFIVEDDRMYAEVLRYRLELNPDYQVGLFSTAAELLAHMHEGPTVVCVDYSLPDTNGQVLLRKLNEQYPNVPAVVISGLEDVAVAIDLLKEPNVRDYLVKDEHTGNRLWEVMINLQPELEGQKALSGGPERYAKLLKGESQQIKDIYSLLDKACRTEITVSVSGPTGTGKELVARCIHQFSTRHEGPFVAVNMSAIPAELAESELFGHEKGAFTGAQQRRIGKFEEASGGTLFLDEIAEMDISLQAKLLRVLQEREVVRIGSNKTLPINVRLVVATHKDLAAEVRKGNFRQDLYYRLLGLSVKLPALAERKDDIIPLAQHFITTFCKQNKKKEVILSKGAVNKLLSYPFPGNVRELKAVIELAIVMAEGVSIEADDLMLNQEVELDQLIDQEHTLKGYTSKIIRHYLERYDHNITLVAQKLDMGKSTLYRMVKNQEV